MATFIGFLHLDGRDVALNVAISADLMLISLARQQE